MSARRPTGQNVFDAAVDRMVGLYEDGHRIVCSFSGGKDSGVCLEICTIAAKLTGRLPVEVVMRDEEIMLPGVFEYCERVAARDTIKFHWLVTHHGNANVFNRVDPFWYTHDPRLHPSQWVREPPLFARVLDEPSIMRMTTRERFAPPEGKDLIAVMGLRAAESMTRFYSIFSSKGFLTKPNDVGVRNARPIYDWTDEDVWLAHKTFGWDYAETYDTLHRMGEPKRKLRIAPPTINVMAIEQLALAAKAWPRWFEKVNQRLPGLRTAAQFGKRTCQPNRRMGETWEQCFKRVCIAEAPAPWLRERAELAMARYLSRHSAHSTAPFPEHTPCRICPGSAGSWRKLALALYNGDPQNSKVDTTILPDLEKTLVQPWRKPTDPPQHPYGEEYRTWRHQHFGF